MDFQAIADSFHAPTCVISIRKKPDGGYGKLRLVAGNAKYIEPIEHPFFAQTPDMPGMPEVFQSTKKFVPNSLYEEYLPKDIGFEAVCSRAAIDKIPIHTYVHLNDIDIWFDIFAMPLCYEQGDLCYCVYTAQPSSSSDVGLSSGQAGTASEDVIKTCIKLHSTDDFTKTMEDVIKDIRLMCRADGCTIIVADSSNGGYSVLATSIDDKCKVRPVTEFDVPGDIIASWLGVFGASDCLIIRDSKDMSCIRKATPEWYEILEAAGVKSLVLFPLKYDNEVLGFFWATNFDTNNTMRIKETLELTTFFISSKMSSYKMVDHLKELSYTDQLTGIPNRIACTEYICGLAEQGEAFTVVSVDISGFKSINDTLGFEAGNKVLIEIASRWKALADNGTYAVPDYVARMGGDDFVLVIHGSRSDDEILDRIRSYEKALGKCLTIDGCDLYIKASFGYSAFPDDANTCDRLLSYANASMNEIKRINSSDHILKFSPELLKEERTLEIERKLIKALENDTVEYRLQPQFDMSHKLRGFEALARMRDTDGSIISPCEFIPVAEKVGLVDKVDGAVLRKAALFIGGIIAKTGADIVLSVNVSVRHLMKNDFIDEIKEVLSASGLPAKDLEIEITESIMIDSAEKALRCIDELHKMGIKIAIDDFGTGYSSLSYLNSFHANILKIDKSFIDKMNTGESSKQVCCGDNLYRAHNGL